MFCSFEKIAHKEYSTLLLLLLLLLLSVACCSRNEQYCRVPILQCQPIRFAHMRHPGLRQLHRVSSQMTTTLLSAGWTHDHHHHAHRRNGQQHPPCERAPESVEGETERVQSSTDPEGSCPSVTQSEQS